MTERWTHLCTLALAATRLRRLRRLVGLLGLLLLLDDLAPEVVQVLLVVLEVGGVCALDGERQSSALVVADVLLARPHLGVRERCGRVRLLGDRVDRLGEQLVDVGVRVANGRRLGRLVVKDGLGAEL